MIAAAGLPGFDTGTDALARWASALNDHSPVSYDAATELLSASTNNQHLLTPYLFRVAEAALALFTIATQRGQQ